MLQTLSSIGVGDLTLDLGHVTILDELQRLANIDAPSELALGEALKTKSLQQVDTVLDGLDIDVNIKQQLRAVATIQGGKKALEQLVLILEGVSPAVDAALTELDQTYRSIAKRFPSVSIFIDLTEMRGFDYHTGLVFSALSTVSGKPLANGGRYNDISRQFGRDRTATGFNCDLKALCSVATIEPPALNEPIYVATHDVEALWNDVEKLRREGEVVIEGQAPKGGRQLIHGDSQAKLITL